MKRGTRWRRRYAPFLWLLVGHGGTLDGPDFFVGGGLLGLGEGVDVVEDVGCFCDGEGGAHLGEHVVLGEAWVCVSLILLEVGLGVQCMGL